MDSPLPLGTKTPWGRIVAIFSPDWPSPSVRWPLPGGGRLGERYYMMTKGEDSVALMPASIVETEQEVKGENLQRTKDGV